MVNSLEGLLPPERVVSLFRSFQESILGLPDTLVVLVREDFVNSFNLQIQISLGFAVGPVLASLIM